jgi:hypothetical protein
MEVLAEKLLTVEDAFAIEGRGIVVTPFIPVAQYRDKRTKMFVLLRKPDGTESRVEARFSMPHVPHPDKLCFGCLLAGSKKEDVPVGSEIYRLVDPDEPEA